MKCYAFRTIRTLFCFSVFVLLAGCTSNLQEIDASANTTGGDLQQIGPGICQEVKNGRMWQLGRSKLLYSPQEAAEYAASLELGGHTDWRLPTREELFNLYYIFYWKNNGDCTLKHQGEYWTVAEEGEPAPGHWETYFACGPIHKYVESIRQKGYVRAVRP